MSVSGDQSPLASAPVARAGEALRRPELATGIGWGVFVGLVLAYVAVLAGLTSFPFQDLPNHLARAVVLDDLLLHGGARFGGVFEFHAMPIPYSLGDVFVTAAVEWLGPTAAGVLWNSLALLSLPAALLFYFRVHRLRSDVQVLFLILSLYLATDWFFVTALSEFRFAVALIVVALALADRLRDQAGTPGSPPSGPPGGGRAGRAGLVSANRGYLLYVAVVLIGYFVHLAMPVFLVPVLGITAVLRWWRGCTTARRELALLAPAVAVLAWHFGSAPLWQHEGDLPVYHFWWGSLWMKLTGLIVHNFEFTRFDVHGTRLLLLAFALFVLWLAGRQLRWPQLMRPRVLELLTLALAFIGAYLVLPIMYAEAAYVDVRALVMVSLFLFLAAAHLVQSPVVAQGGRLGEHTSEASRAAQTAQPQARRSGNLMRIRFALPIAALLAGLNLVSVAVPLVKDNSFVRRYRDVVAAIPPRAYVLPVFTRLPQGLVMPLLHIGSFAVTDRGAVIPYLFTGDRGAPVKYFRYAHRLYAPPEWWYQPAYVPTGDVMVSWRAVACEYDFLLVMKPYTASYIGVPTRLITENDSAALLAVGNRSFACLPGERHR